MFLSDRDLRHAIDHGLLIVDPYPGKPKQVGPTSIDLHLDKVEEAKVWDIPKFRERNKELGHGDVPELRIGKFDYKAVAGEFQKAPRLVKGDESPPDESFSAGGTSSSFALAASCCGKRRSESARPKRARN